jgi:hypothetical protein
MPESLYGIEFNPRKINELEKAQHERMPRPSNRGVLLWKGNLSRKYLIHFVIPLSLLFLDGCTPAFLIPGSLPLVAPVVLALLAIPVILTLRKSGGIPAVKDLLADNRFNEENITHTFIAALPTLTRKMNLEVASSKQTEVLERSDDKRFLSIHLGTNSARMTVPVTYRYHIRLYDPWELHIGGSTLIVCAPEITCSLPPAIHTDEIAETTTRGWGRGSPIDLMEDLRRELTPVLSQYANDHRRLELVRDACRQSVAEFIRRWLKNEDHWKPGKFTAINVKFATEPVVPSSPTLQLLSFNQ